MVLKTPRVPFDIFITILLLKSTAPPTKDRGRKINAIKLYKS